MSQLHSDKCHDLNSSQIGLHNKDIVIKNS